MVLASGSLGERREGPWALSQARSEEEKEFSGNLLSIGRKRSCVLVILVEKTWAGAEHGASAGNPWLVAAVEWKIVAGCRCIFNKAFSSPFSRQPVVPLSSERCAEGI